MAQGDLLSAIARGLRAGAGVLSPEVFAQNERERQLKIMKSDEGQQVITSMLLEGVQSGAIDPDRGMEALRRINPQMAEQLSGVTMGPSIAAQKQIYDAALKQQEREAIGQIAQQLGLPAGTPDSLVSAAYRTKNAPQKTGSISKIAQLGEDFRAGRITRDQYEAAVRKANYIAPAGGSGDPGFGKGIEGLSYSALLEVDRLNRAGQPVPPELQARADVARHILSQERIVVGPNGERMAYTPGLPAFMSQPTQKPAASTRTPSGGSLTTIATKEGESSPRQALDAISGVADILNEAAESGETITGVLGTAKRYGGGLARQAGIPVSPRAERLSRALERLQAMVGPEMLQDSRLSNDERKRVEQIVGSVDAFTDEVALRESLSDLAAILGKAGGAAGKTGGQQPAIGNSVTRGGRSYRVVGYDTDGEPLVEPE